MASTRQVDEHVWTEIRNFKKCLLQMFMAQVCSLRSDLPPAHSGCYASVLLCAPFARLRGGCACWALSCSQSCLELCIAHMDDLSDLKSDRPRFYEVRR